MDSNDDPAARLDQAADANHTATYWHKHGPLTAAALLIAFAISLLVHPVQWLAAIAIAVCGAATHVAFTLDHLYLGLITHALFGLAVFCAVAVAVGASMVGPFAWAQCAALYCFGLLGAAIFHGAWSHATRRAN